MKWWQWVRLYGVVPNEVKDFLNALEDVFPPAEQRSLLTWLSDAEEIGVISSKERHWAYKACEEPLPV